MKTILPAFPLFLAGLLSVPGRNTVADVIADSRGKDVKGQKYLSLTFD